MYLSSSPVDDIPMYIKKCIVHGEIGRYLGTV